MESMRKDTSPRFYAESDGGPGSKEWYIVDRYADPLSEHRRTEPGLNHGYFTVAERRNWARKKARQFNENPPWPAWDHIQAKRDEYAGPIEKG